MSITVIKDKNHQLAKVGEGLIPYRLINDYMFRAVMQKNVIALKCVINLEVQVMNLKDWPERSLYYLSRAFCNLQRGDSYTDVMPCIHIGVLNFTLFPDSREFYSEYYMQNIRTHKIYSDKFAIHVLDLTQIEASEAKEKHPDIYYWAKLFTARTWEEIEMLSNQSEGIQEAVLTLKELTEDEKIKLQCEAREMYEHTMASAKKAGRIEGLAEGLTKGEFQANINTARNMLKKGMSITDICDITGLSESDVNQFCQATDI